MKLWQSTQHSALCSCCLLWISSVHTGATTVLKPAKSWTVTLWASEEALAWGRAQGEEGSLRFHAAQTDWEEDLPNAFP